MNNIVLSKESTNNEVREYFNSIFNLSKSANEFPVNLDEVWPLVYGKKSDAVEALLRDFIENVDYKVLRQNPQNPQGGRPTNEYLLSVPCLEFFIARKVRPVFEVYRQVFHKVANEEAIKPATIRDKMAVATWLIKTLNLNDNSKLKLAKTIADPLGLPTPDYTESKDQLLSATELLKRCGSKLSAQAFNAKMLAKGFLTTLQRQSHQGVKKFKSLTAKGLVYGENQVSPNNPKETQPLYYVGKFDELLNAIAS